MDRNKIAYDLLARAKYNHNSFLYTEFVYPSMIKGLDSFTDEELEHFMLRSECKSNDFHIAVPALTYVVVTVNTNKSIEEVKSDLISCNNDLYKLISKFEVDYNETSDTRYARCVGEPEVRIIDLNDDENEIVYDY
jgi:hypothetical protein